jgi:hypothetical protein
MEERNIWERIPRLDGGEFNPAALIHAVNSLHSMGEVRGTAVVRDWAKWIDNDADTRRDGFSSIGRLHLVIRLRWRPDPPHQAWPILSLGRPDVDLPPPDSHWPLSPLVVCDDWPFLLVRGYRVGGALAEAISIVERLLEVARWHNRPLTPGPDPLAAANKLIASAAWRSLMPIAQSERIAMMVREQAQRVLPIRDETRFI